MTDSPRRADGPAHDERLTVPLWWWPPALGVVVLCAAQIHLGYPGVRAWLPYLVLVPVAVVVLLRLGRARVRVADDELRVGAATLPLRFVGEVEVIGKADRRVALGPELDPAAYVLHRAWVGPLLRVRLTDPADPTPYWVFSTRHPQRLATTLANATTPQRDP